MVKVISICSGKGGVGKTVIATNLAMALRKLHKRVLVLDFNFTTPHISLYFGLFSHPVTLNSFLRNETDLEDVVYNHESGLDIIPSSLNLTDIVNVETDNLREKLKEAFWYYDYVIIDSAPGLGKEALISLRSCDEVIFVANPQIPSLVDIAKTLKVINALDPKVVPLGIIINRVRGKNYEASINEIKEFTELPILGIVPEDQKILETENKKTIITLSDMGSVSSRAIIKIAANIADIQYEHPGFFRLFINSIFKTHKEFL